jgi:hypothetical protein
MWVSQVLTTVANCKNSGRNCDGKYNEAHLRYLPYPVWGIAWQKMSWSDVMGNG